MQNKKLKERYEITGFPTVLLLDADGEVLGKLGYMKTPSQWIAAAESHLASGLVKLAKHGDPVKNSTR
jgi:thioredoxin-related protein